MNREELKKMISLIDDDKLAEAAASSEQRGFSPANRPKVCSVWQKTLMAAAVVVLVICFSFRHGVSSIKNRALQLRCLF